MTITEMTKMFYDTFGEGGELRVFKSPGRVNLIGEHIDYCGGCVMPAALTMNTTIIARKRDDNVIRLKATDLDILVDTTYDEAPSLKGKLKWGDYQLGVAMELIADGYQLVGCDMLFDDEVPHGGGLSSSAAIEVSTALALTTFANEKKGDKTPVDMIYMAKISQRAEHNFIGVKCGIMDQFASAMGKANNAVYLNCDTLEYEHIPLDLGDSRLVIINTNVKHSLGNSAYNERRLQCEAGLDALKGKLPHINCLADVTPEEFEKYKNEIADDTVRTRVKHVVAECNRVRESAMALKNGDIASFGKLMCDSHDSLQFDYEVSCPELDFLSQNGRKMDGVLGIRMTGGGFGGSAVAIIKSANVDEFIATMGEAYEREFGHSASFYVTVAGNGGHEEVQI